MFNTVEHDFNPEVILEFKNNVALYSALMLFKDTVEKNIKILNKIFDFWGKNDFIDYDRIVDGKALSILVFIIETWDITREELEKKLEESNIKGGDIMPTLADRLREEGYQKGKKIGEEVGEKRGEERGEKRGEEKGEKRGEEKGEMNSKIQTAETMLDLNYSLRDISAVTKLSIEKVKDIQKSMKSHLSPEDENSDS